jgi:hypothetical protein
MRPKIHSWFISEPFFRFNDLKRILFTGNSMYTLYKAYSFFYWILLVLFNFKLKFEISISPFFSKNRQIFLNFFLNLKIFFKFLKKKFKIFFKFLKNINTKLDNFIVNVQLKIWFPNGYLGLILIWPVLFFFYQLYYISSFFVRLHYKLLHFFTKYSMRIDIETSWSMRDSTINLFRTHRFEFRRSVVWLTVFFEKFVFAKTWYEFFFYGLIAPSFLLKELFWFLVFIYYTTYYFLIWRPLLYGFRRLILWFIPFRREYTRLFFFKKYFGKLPLRFVQFKNKLLKFFTWCFFKKFFKISFLKLIDVGRGLKYLHKPLKHQYWSFLHRSSRLKEVKSDFYTNPHPKHFHACEYDMYRYNVVDYTLEQNSYKGFRLLQKPYSTYHTLFQKKKAIWWLTSFEGSFIRAFTEILFKNQISALPVKSNFLKKHSGNVYSFSPFSRVKPWVINRWNRESYLYNFDILNWRLFYERSSTILDRQSKFLKYSRSFYINNFNLMWYHIAFKNFKFFMIFWWVIKRFNKMVFWKWIQLFIGKTSSISTKTFNGKDRVKAYFEMYQNYAQIPTDLYPNYFLKNLGYLKYHSYTARLRRKRPVRVYKLKWFSHKSNWKSYLSGMGNFPFKGKIPTYWRLQYLFKRDLRGSHLLKYHWFLYFNDNSHYYTHTQSGFELDSTNLVDFLYFFI